MAGEAEHPYGPGWEDLHQRTLERDDHACTRCGADDRSLQAHHIVPRGVGGPDTLENLVTVCRPCHGVMHPDNGSFDDVRHEAPLFPRPDAPEPVRRMREPADQVCDRCGSEHADPADLLARRTDGASVVLCLPCARLVTETVPAWSPADLEGVLEDPTTALESVAKPATVRPSVFAPEPVAVRRQPTTLRERVVDDTPLRFALNSRLGQVATIVVVGYLALFVLLAL